jgi:dephospho-CoA kinase
MLKVGITGGIGSGKSTVCKIFEILGVPVYYADYEAKELINTDQNIKVAIIKLFGVDAYLNGFYNVPFVKKKVLGDKILLDALNQIVHPAVANHFLKWMEEHNGSPLILKEAAIMERGIGLDKIIHVMASEGLRIQRISKRDQERSMEEIKDIMTNQKSQKAFSEISHYNIENDRELLIPQVLALHEKLSAISS